AEGMRAGSILVDMSTNGIAVIQEVEKELQPKGIKVMDAPVGKVPWAAEKGELTILMGGDEAVCREAEWVSEWSAASFTIAVRSAPVRW
ncbi:MAG: NAD(P)-binding domain-containing protein, partial [Xanthobacteraceae bacterium]